MKKIKKLFTFIASIFLSLLVSVSAITPRAYEAKAYDATYQDDYVSAIKFIPGYNTSMTFMIITLGETDYSTITENGGNDYSLGNYGANWTEICNFWDKQIVYNNSELSFSNFTAYLVYYANANALGFDFTSCDTLYATSFVSLSTFSILFPYLGYDFNNLCKSS